MAWNKNKILLLGEDVDENGNKVISRYESTKSKGKGKPNLGKLVLNKMHKITRRHVPHKETKWK